MAGNLPWFFIFQTQHDHHSWKRAGTKFYPIYESLPPILVLREMLIFAAHKSQWYRSNGPDSGIQRFLFRPLSRKNEIWTKCGLNKVLWYRSTCGIVYLVEMEARTSTRHVLIGSWPQAFSIWKLLENVAAQFQRIALWLTPGAFYFAWKRGMPIES